MLGVGSELRGDDFAGVLVARRIEAWRKRAKVERVAGFEGCSAPENVTGQIAKFRPSHLLLVDAARLGKSPGDVELLDAAKITGVSFSTHMLPAPIILDYLEKTAGCRALVVGIEPTQTDVLGPISEPVARAIDAVVETVRRAFSKPPRKGMG